MTSTTRPKQPTPAQLRDGPSFLQRTIPPEWEDYNGHVNIQFYMALYEEGGWAMSDSLGINEAYFSVRRCGIFDLEHHVCYLSEMHVGDRVNVYSRLLGRTAKRFHGLLFIVNDTNDTLASSLEYVTSGANLDTRRTTTFPEDIAANIDQAVERSRALSWAPPLCGVISA